MYKDAHAHRELDFMTTVMVKKMPYILTFLSPRSCEEEQSYIFLVPVQLGMYLAYMLIFLVGVVGNMLVLVVVLTNPHMQTTTNMYLVNLSAADIVMCFGKCLI